MTRPNDPKQQPDSSASDEETEDHRRSLRLAYGDISTDGPRYGDQQFRPGPFQTGHDEEEDYYEALSASTIPPLEQEGAADPPIEVLQPNRPDDELERAVAEVLAFTDGVDAATIDVKCKDGIVTLGGRAIDRATKRAADDAAYGVLGVKDVMNLIVCT